MKWALPTRRISARRDRACQTCARKAWRLNKSGSRPEARLNQLLGRSGDKGFGGIPEIESDLPDWTFDQLMLLPAKTITNSAIASWGWR